jgi:hypothetical protein
MLVPLVVKEIDQNKEPVPSTERSIINIQGILANSAKLKGSGNLIWRDGWKRPATGVYKLNVDAAFDADTGRGATRAIIRDFGRKLCCSIV